MGKRRPLALCKFPLPQNATSEWCTPYPFPWPLRRDGLPLRLCRVSVVPQWSSKGEYAAKVRRVCLRSLGTVVRLQGGGGNFSGRRRYAVTVISGLAPDAFAIKSGRSGCQIWRLRPLKVILECSIAYIFCEYCCDEVSFSMV